jgi:hypothetical protein
MTRRFFILSFLFVTISCTLFEKEEKKEDEPQGIEINPGEDIQAIVDAYPEGTAFIIKSGIHRMQEIWPKEAIHSGAKRGQY